MTDFGPLENVRNWGKGRFLGRCPNCGLVARLDADQVHGRVSVNCPDCPYHETHDYSSQVEKPGP